MKPYGKGRSAMASVLLGCLALAAAGCGDKLTDCDDCGCDECWDDGPYPVLSHPHNTLRALEIAYASRDSTKCKDLYDSTYTGSSVDVQDPSTRIDFTFFDEVQHVATLASTPGLTAHLELGSPAAWNLIRSDDPSHPDWVVVQIVGSSYRVEIFEGSHGVEATGEPGTVQEFAFSPTLDSTSPTDTLWRIVRWREVGNSAPDPTP